MPKKQLPGAVLNGIMRDIDCNGSPVEILPIADLHVGDAHCDYDRIAAMIASVRDNPNRYAVLAGDLMNTAIANSKSDVYGETMTPGQQLDKCTELFAQIADKIIAIVPGNHEERITRQCGVDMPRVLAQRLGLEQVYEPDAALLFLRFGSNAHGGKMVYSLYINHGHGGGRRVGGKLNSLQDYALVVDADVYIVGHTHLPATYKSGRYKVVPQKFNAQYREQLFVNTASSLLYGGYGKRGGYQPPSNSYPVITLDDKEFKTTCTL